MEIINVLFQTLYSKSQLILNVMELISSTKIGIHKLRDHGWNTLFEKVNSFYETRNINVRNIQAFML